MAHFCTSDADCWPLLECYNWLFKRAGAGPLGAAWYLCGHWKLLISVVWCPLGCMCAKCGRVWNLDWRQEEWNGGGSSSTVPKPIKLPPSQILLQRPDVLYSIYELVPCIRRQIYPFLIHAQALFSGEFNKLQDDPQFFEPYWLLPVHKWRHLWLTK